MAGAGAEPFIVVGADGSPLSAAALRWAVAHARRTDARIEVVTGWEVPMTIFVTPTYTEDDYGRDAREALDQTVSALPDTDGVTINTHLVRLRPALALAQAAEGAELLVVGSHGRGELPGMHLGSVATYCVHHAPCPVLVYRESSRGR
jgi:nucleotide-binding universal stress UspA family protein